MNEKYTMMRYLFTPSSSPSAVRCVMKAPHLFATFESTSKRNLYNQSMRVFTSVILFAVIGIDKGDSFLFGKSAVKKTIRSTSTVRAASSTGTIITNASTLPTWEDLAERNQGDEETPLLTFFRDTNGW